MHNKLKIIGHAFLVLIILFAGIFIGNAIGAPGEFRVNKELNLLHGLSIFISLGCLVLISIFIDLRKESSRKSRECVHKKLTQLTEVVGKCRKYSTKPSKIPFAEVNAHQKRISTLSRDLKELIQITKIPIDASLIEFEEDAKALWSLLTTTPIAQQTDSEEPDVVIRENLVTYGVARRNEIDLCLDKLEKKLLLTEIQLFGGVQGVVCKNS